jgi:hypothetical protein
LCVTACATERRVHRASDRVACVDVDLCREYTGECSWAPTEWQSMVDTMLYAVPHTSLYTWNEVVASNPLSHEEEAQRYLAVFYRVHAETDPAEREFLRRAAEANGAMLGRPVLVADDAKFTAGGPLFECAEEADRER